MSPPPPPPLSSNSLPPPPPPPTSAIPSSTTANPSSYHHQPYSQYQFPPPQLSASGSYQGPVKNLRGWNDPPPLMQPPSSSAASASASVENTTEGEGNIALIMLAVSEAMAKIKSSSLAMDVNEDKTEIHNISLLIHLLYI